MAVLFDLDGTLTDPEPGIVRSIQFALDRLDAPVPHEDELDWCIGPSLRGSFATLLANDDPAVVEGALALYRQRFSTVGLFENAVYPGIPEALIRLRDEGFPLFLATSKPHVYARRILDHFDLTRFFDGVYGDELDGRLADKAHLIDHLLASENLAKGETIMVGDREHDVLGARANGLPCLGVTYGYGGAEELDAAGAAALCARPERVADAVLDLFRRLALSC